MTRSPAQQVSALPATTSPPRIPELDGFRGIAVLMVLFYHLFAYAMVSGHWTGLARRAVAATEDGWRGVDLFFVLSGFLITGILLDGRRDPHYFRNFYARRALRILPLYYVVLIVLLLGYSHSGGYVLLSFCFLSNLAPMFHLPLLNGAMWSLSVEEHYYLVWPLIVRRLSLRAVAVTALAICGIEPIVRALSLPHVGSGNIYIYSWFRLDGLASGALIACFVRSAWSSARNVRVLCAITAATAVAMRMAGAPYGILTHDTRFGAAFQFVPVNLIFSAAILYAVANSGSIQTAILRNRFLRIAADLSYCLYLIHFLVISAYDATLNKLGLPRFSGFGGVLLRASVVLVLCFILAAVSRKVLEVPALRLKRFFTPESRKTLSAALAAAN
ncbi:MAG TPA: acyltransferase [Bryobacteraceae bacterium]|nr:acyltransferase [Bryobacteraceae bacterium]